jgi:hypothetical protein
MPPKKGSGSSKDKESDAIAVEEQRQAKRSREIFDTAVDGRQLSRVRPSSLRELVPSKLLRRSDCKDVHKRSSVKKSRYMTIFPGQLAHLKEGKIGSLAKLDTQNPVLYIEYGALGRLKLEGTIVRSKTTRYFTLNVKSRDRLNLEDWFDSCVVFGRYAWVGTVDENPGETPLPFPDALKHVAAAAADKNDNGNDKNDESAKKEDEEEPMDPAVAACVAAAKAAYKPPTEADLWTQSVAAEEGAKPIVSRNIADDDDDDDDAPADEPRGAKRIHPDAKRESDDYGVIEVGSDTDDDEARPTQTQGTDAGGRRPRRESAKAVNYAKYDGGDDELFEEEEEEAGVFRGRATATVAKEAPAGFAAHSLGPGKKEKAPAKPRAPKKEKKKEEEEVISIDDDGSDDDEPLAARPAAKGGQKSLLGFLKPGAGGEKPRPKRASVEAAKPVKRKHVLDSDDDEDDEDESEEEDDDDDWA